MTMSGGRDDLQLLRRGLLAYFLFTASEWAAWVAVLVHAFAQGGAVAAALATLVQLGAAALAAPFGATWLASWRHEEALRRSFALQALAFGATGVALWLNASLAIIIPLASTATAAITLTRPVYFSQLTRHALSGSQLGRWNGLSILVEGLAILTGPAVAGMLLGTQLLAMAAIPRTCHREAAATHAVPSSHWPANLRAGLAGMLSSGAMRTILASIAGGFFLVGSIDVLAVIFASETLRLGPAAPGRLISALGAGSVLGAGSLALVAHWRRPGRPLIVGALLACVPFAMTAASPGLHSASLWLVGAGIGKGMLDVIGRTALQQRLCGASLATAFGCQECISHLALAGGALLALPLVAAFGARGAFVASAAVLPMLCIIAAASSLGMTRRRLTSGW
jgi:hypothetical protein